MRHFLHRLLVSLFPLFFPSIDLDLVNISSENIWICRFSPGGNLDIVFSLLLRMFLLRASYRRVFSSLDLRLMELSEIYAGISILLRNG